MADRRGSSNPVILVPTQAGARATAGGGVQGIQALNRAYVTALQSAGLIPLLIPTRTPLPKDLSFADGLLLPGGPDVDPLRYGQDLDPATDPDQESDQLDFALLDWALNAGIPVLAICRGLQVLNVALGGSLFQDLPRHSPRPNPEEPVARDVPVHTVRVEESSRLGQIVQARTISVNSMHHQGIDELGRGLVATAWAYDGLVEAVEGRGNTFLLGVQYHPEELVDRDPTARAIFVAFAAACRENKSGQTGETATPELVGSVPSEVSAG
ncbi:MAG TPA: gamma-glutamyl-gamma-aminobutyrate hydrolase family protein [Candidatus Dormibacteraeota bacterium]|nr:gamma-glutamyl-gamma-aminobutyrate hydrolase family protein [Candidatus Dormibacteraeota bacterium]